MTTVVAKRGDAQALHKAITLLKTEDGVSLAKKKDDKGRLPLHLAAGARPFSDVNRTRLRELIALLLRLYPEGAATKAEYDYLPLHFMAKRGFWYRNTAQLIFDAFPDGANEVASESGFTPLHFATLRKEESWVRFLQANCPDTVGKKDKNGNLPIHAATRQGKDALVEFLYACNPNTVKEPNHYGQLPIHLAAMSNANPRIFDFLLEKYPDGAKHLDHEGDLPIHVAVRAGASHAVTVLVQHFPELLDEKNNASLSPLHLCCRNNELFCFLAQKRPEMLHEGDKPYEHLITYLEQKSRFPIYQRELLRKIFDIPISEHHPSVKGQLQMARLEWSLKAARDQIKTLEGSLKKCTSEKEELKGLLELRGLEKQALEQSLKEEKKKKGLQPDRQELDQYKQRLELCVREKQELDKSLAMERKKNEKLKAIFKECNGELSNLKTAETEQKKKWARMKQQYNEERTQLRTSLEEEKRRGREEKDKLMKFLAQRDSEKQQLEEILAAERKRIDEEKRKLEASKEKKYPAVVASEHQGDKENLERHVVSQSRELELLLLERMSGCENQLSMKELKSLSSLLNARLELLESASNSKPSLVHVMFAAFIASPKLEREPLIQCIEQLNDQIVGIEASTKARNGETGMNSSEDSDDLIPVRVTSAYLDTEVSNRPAKRPRVSLC